MPMDRNLYPKDWETIALSVKDEANWHCEKCSRPCRKKGETLREFEIRMGFDELNETIAWFSDYWEQDAEEAVKRPRRFGLTVAHLDHQPSNSDRRNLKALCNPCHCRYDLNAMPLKKNLKRERRGQLNLFNKANEDI